MITLRDKIIALGMEHGLTESDAAHQTDSFLRGNTGAYTAAIRRIIEVRVRSLCGND